MVDLNLQKYPVYKSSGIEWLGDIPEHWEVKKIKRITQTHKQGYYTENPYIDEGVKLARITDIDDFGNVSFENMPFVEISEKNEKSFQLKKGDFLFARSGTIGRFGLVNALESSVFASYLIRFRFKNVEPEFLKFAFSSSFFKESLISTLHGGANNNVHAENIKEQILVIPPTSEQQAIANFLDEKIAQIDEYIAKKQRIIELLKEQKTVIINQAVTKGINPDVPMQDSGVEWLGDIPEHWEAIQIKRCLKSYRYGISDSIRGEGEFKVLTMGNIQDGKVLIPEMGNLESVPEELILEYGDLLFNRTNSLDLVGKVGIFQGSKEDKISFASYLLRLKVNNDTNPVYLNFLLDSHGLLNVARQRALVSLNQVNLNPTVYCQLTIPLPPISEQQEIASFIEKKSEKINRAIATTEKEIKLIQEYRKALISETVTGKIDVRKYHPSQ